MSELYHLQIKFQQYLLGKNQNINNNIAITNAIPIATRLNIYKNAYQSRLLSALSISYPVLKKYLGADNFEELCNEYITAYPSNYRSIRWFGDALGNFLNRYQKYQAFSFLSELAQFEWTLGLVFDAAECNTIQIENMASVPHNAWINMRFHTHPSIHFLKLSWNIISIWQAILENKTPPDAKQDSITTHWILWRKEFLSQFSSLPKDEAWALDAAQKNATFGEICAGLCQWNEEQQVGTRAALLLKEWLIAGLIIKLVYH